MRRLHIYLYVVFCLAVFILGISELHSYDSYNAVGSLTVTCDRAFNSQCTRPGQCSYNIAHTASNCKLTCETKYTLNGDEHTTTLTAECGTWKDDGDPGDGGGGTGDPGGGFAWYPWHEDPIDASGQPMFKDDEESSDNGSEKDSK